MTRVLLFGFGPLPGEGGQALAPAVRTWHIAQALLDAGHHVCLFAWQMAVPDQADGRTMATRIEGRLAVHCVPANLALADLRRAAAAWNGECAIGICMAGASRAVEVIGDLPLWADLYGSAPAEAQLKANLHSDDGYLRYFLLDELRAVQRADAFSCVSERQMWSLIGELGLCGRLNHWTAGYSFATVIPAIGETAECVAPRRVFRGSVVPETAFVVLHTGGYNTWYDVDTLFQALERVMSNEPAVHFVSTGGQLPGHDEQTYERLRTMIAGSQHRDRYHQQGWVPAEDLPGYYLESDVGVVADRSSYEAQLGSRTRVLDWLRAELPCVLSEQPELAREVAAAGAGLTYRAGDAESLAACLERCAADRPGTAAMGRRGRQLLLERYTLAATAGPLLAWVATPRHAPDYARPYPRFLCGPSRRLLALRTHIGRRALKVKGARMVWSGLKRAALRALNGPR